MYKHTSIRVQLLYQQYQIQKVSYQRINIQEEQRKFVRRFVYVRKSNLTKYGIQKGKRIRGNY